jgi:hypothetical protein
MAIRTSSQSGNWSDPATWGANPAPGNGDTAIISTANVVTVDVDTTVGTSPVNGTAVVTTSGTGRLIIAGHLFRIRGDFQGHSTDGPTPSVTMQAGSIWEFDSSLAASPATTKYQFRCDGNGGANVRIESNGTSGNRNTIRSNAGGGNGYFSLGASASAAGGFVATYTDLLRIGDATNPAFSLVSGNFDSELARWNVQHCSFDSCGLITNNNANWPTANTPWINSFNRHTNSAHPTGIMLFSFSNPVGGGVRQMIGNVFDGLVGTDGVVTAQTQDVTITDNYFGNNTTAGSSTWASFARNFWRLTSGSYGAFGDVTDSILFMDSFTDTTSHAPNTPNATWSFLRNVTDCSFFTINVPDVSDGVVGNTGGTFLINVKNNIIVPAGDGRGCSALVGNQYTSPSNSMVVEHNTASVGSTGGIEIAGSADASGASVGTIKNNILWDTSARAWALVDAGHGTGATPVPQTDFFPVANILNNVRFNLLATIPGRPFLTNQGNSYGAKWSVTPGASDLTVDPQFVDPTRNTATFDTAYLHNVAGSTWASHAGTDTFNVGDVVSNQDPSYYANALINYRCILSHTKNTANSEPGIGSDWHTYWEFNSLASIRDALFAGTTISAFGLVNATYIQILWAWVRAGFAPLNQALKGAATDGGDIGAIAVANIPSVLCDAPPVGFVGVAYSHAFPASGGTPPFTFSISAGALPNGLSIDAATGIVSGIPTLKGTFPFTLLVTDSLAVTASVSCSITIRGKCLIPG